MSRLTTDRVFSGAVAAVYDTYLVPLIFEPYAADLVGRLTSRSLTGVLEVAAGSGVVTRALAAALPARVVVVATDLNRPMLERAAAVGTARAVEWRQADAMALPFPDGSFDAVVCQFGVMFFPDKPKAYAEARRVLRPGGVFIFNVWDRIEENEFADTVTAALGALFPRDPPRFLPRTAHGYHDRRGVFILAQRAAARRDSYVVERELGRGGMATVHLARDLKHDRSVGLEALLRVPYMVSPGWLRVDPTFAPLRANPRFSRLVEGGP
jgi:SAM-dependent methyltransferase